jgi:hypothetical protein
MKERISTFCWVRLGTPPRLNKYDLKKIAGTIFEKSAHSGIFYYLLYFKEIQRFITKYH